jgi:hypothetical protein
MSLKASADADELARQATARCGETHMITATMAAPINPHSSAVTSRLSDFKRSQVTGAGQVSRTEGSSGQAALNSLTRVGRVDVLNRKVTMLHGDAEPTTTELADRATLRALLRRHFGFHQPRGPGGAVERDHLQDQALPAVATLRHERPSGDDRTSCRRAACWQVFEMRLPCPRPSAASSPWPDHPPNADARLSCNRRRRRGRMKPAGKHLAIK